MILEVLNVTQAWSFLVDIVGRGPCAQKTSTSCKKHKFLIIFCWLLFARCSVYEKSKVKFVCSSYHTECKKNVSHRIRLTSLTRYDCNSAQCIFNWNTSRKGKVHRRTGHEDPEAE